MKQWLFVTSYTYTSYTFDKPYTCKECCKNKYNYTKADDDIIFIDSRDKRIKITSETELDVINIHITANNSKVSGNEIF